MAVKKWSFWPRVEETSHNKTKLELERSGDNNATSQYNTN